MKLRTKILLSLTFQIFLFFAVPALLSRSGILGAKFIRHWDYVEQHAVFSDSAPNKAVILGASDFGDRYCEDPTQGGAADDVCTMAAVMGFEKEKYPHLRDFGFFNLSMGGTFQPEVHLYFLLKMLQKVPDGSIKYLIYDHPKRFFADPKQFEEMRFYLLQKDLLTQIEGLPTALKSARLTRLGSQLREIIARMEAAGIRPGPRDHLEALLKYFQVQRGWFTAFQVWARDQISTGADYRMFQTYLNKHNEMYGARVTDEYSRPPHKKPGAYKFLETPEDFDFMEILDELCRKKGIQLVLYYAPNRIYWSAADPEPFNSKIFQPARRLLEPRGVRFFDYRELPYNYPRDTQDGDHPTLSSRLVIANKMLQELEAMEAVR